MHDIPQLIETIKGKRHAGKKAGKGFQKPYNL
jgi:hypothetical protein